MTTVDGIVREGLEEELEAIDEALGEERQQVPSMDGDRREERTDAIIRLRAIAASVAGLEGDANHFSKLSATRGGDILTLKARVAELEADLRAAATGANEYHLRALEFGMAKLEATTARLRWALRHLVEAYDEVEGQRQLVPVALFEQARRVLEEIE